MKKIEIDGLDLESLNVAWDIAKMIVKNSIVEYGDLYNVFLTNNKIEIFNNYSAAEAIAVINRYKNKTNFKAGDIVVGPNGEAALVTKIKDFNHICLLWPDGSVCIDNSRFWVKREESSFYGEVLDEIIYAKPLVMGEINEQNNDTHDTN